MLIGLLSSTHRLTESLASSRPGQSNQVKFIVESSLIDAFHQVSA